ncbi:MAG: hypothetical protein R3261_07170, partial [Alphaproteobacteria bacterium]|nr:hypothetical protein [Alphaproteobacteria bacterium]
MPGLSGGKGVYVLPWTDLDKVVSMSLHDRALFKGISQIREFRPSEIRKIALTIQADGYDGPDMAEAARDALRQTDENLLLTNLILISEALKQVGDGVTFHPDDLINEENMVQARQAFRVYSEKVGLNVQQLMSIFEEWSQLLVNVGSPDGEHVGYLMETIGGLAQLAAEISDWCEDETPENVVLAQQVIDATEMSGRLAYEYI